MNRLKLQGFGPIGKGWVDLSPLTILIGPNACGKSYAAMALHSLGKASSVREPIFARFDGSLNEGFEENLRQISHRLDDENECEISKDVGNEIIEFYCDSLSNTLQERLEDTFAVRLSDLITVGRDKIVLELETDFARIKFGYYEGWGELKVEEYPTVEKPIRASLQDVDDIQESGFISHEGDYFKFNIPKRRIRFQSGPEGFLGNLTLCLDQYFLPRAFGNSYYLPAPRAGFLESHDILSAGAFNVLSSAGIEPIEVPAFSGAVSDYLTTVANISTSEKDPELAEIARKFEDDVLGGEVEVEEAEDQPQPDITFKQHDREFPFHLTSTGIAELAPLSLYTKHELSSESMMVIEEPEAHLHPENQRNIASFIAELIDQGVQIIVTTHSDFFLEQLNNMIRLSNIPRDERQGSNLQDVPILPPEDVSVNMFYTETDIEYKPEKLGINGIEGIPMDQFEQASDELYGEAYEVDKLLRETSWEGN